MRQKRLDVVIKEAEAFIEEGGYREISLYSLSSGDYRHIDALVSSLDRRFSARHVSFQLPSLKISTFSLSLLEKISRVRKSGLTFAVETPLDAWQLAINKQVSLEDTCAILAEAKKSGWRGAKFYFLLGLPHSAENEAEAIVDFVIETGRRTGTHCTVSLGIFIPKPHTPYQWVSQIDGEEARRRCEYIRSRLKPLGHKVNMPDPLASVIEGILSRGDETVCGIIEEAFNLGCRFDAWGEYLRKDVWTDISSRFSGIIQSWLNPAPGKEPAWNCIDSQTDAGYLKREYPNSRTGQLTSTCMINCTHPCRSCSKDIKIVENNIQDDTFSSPVDKGKPPQKSDPDTCRLLFAYEKRGTSVFHSHLDIVEIFSMALIRAGIPVIFTAGFNPIPKIEFVSPLSLGIEAFNEIAAVDTEFSCPVPDWLMKMNAALPQGIRINTAENYLIRSGLKKHSLSSLFWGSGYIKKGRTAPADLVRMRDEKNYRKQAAEQGISNFDLIRTAVFAGAVPASYFDAYGALYPGEPPNT
jgi:hypothetical protein